SPLGKRTAMNQRMESPSHFKDSGDSSAWDRAVDLRNDNPGTGPATALGINSAVQGADRPDWEADSIPGGTQYWEADGWTWDSALTDAGLQVVPEPI
ncbi:unnamed protein product, partial [marine sediment metagenome]